MSGTRFHPSMRLWLALAFALVAGVTAVVAGETMTKRAEHQFKREAERSALAQTRAARAAIAAGVQRGSQEDVVRSAAERRGLALFLLDRKGRPVTAVRSHQTDLASLPQRARATEAALSGRSFVASFDSGRRTVAAVPLPWDGAAALLSFKTQPGYAVPMLVFKEQLLLAVVAALLLGGLIGTAVAWAIASRLRRIAAAAEAVERGEFRTPLPTGLRDEVGDLAATFGRMRMRLEESVGKVTAEQARLRRLLERLDQGVVAVDEDLRVELVNMAAGRLLGNERLREGDPLPEPWPDFPLRHFAADLHKPGAVIKNIRVAPGDGLGYTLFGIPAGSGFKTAVLVITDVSELERRERVQREFVANAAHELRTPVTAITSAIEVLQAGAKELPAERDRFLEILDRQSARLARLGRALLVLARAQSSEAEPQLQPMELCPLLEDVAAGLRTHEGVEVEVECTDGLIVMAERDLVEQVLANLATNASHHTQAGSIRVLGRALPGGGVAIEVIDTGPGIAPDERARIFDRFYRGGSRDSQGFGLGLAIVRQSVRVLGGTVEIDSTRPSGTTVRVTLPEATATAP